MHRQHTAWSWVFFKQNSFSILHFRMSSGVPQNPIKSMIDIYTCIQLILLSYVRTIIFNDIRYRNLHQTILKTYTKFFYDSGKNNTFNLECFVVLFLYPIVYGLCLVHTLKYIQRVVSR